jgi:predicted transposase YbfD/YdcC
MLCTSKKTVKAIVESGNHYTIQVKGNQRTLLLAIKNQTNEAACRSVFEHAERGHGRQEWRRVRVYPALITPKLADWVGLQTYIVVERWRTNKHGTSQQTAFYISDLQCTAEQYYHGIRGHWGIENRLHHVKDVVHNEDKNRVKTGNAPLALAICSSFALNIHRKNGTQSISYAQIKAHANLGNAIKQIRT